MLTDTDLAAALRAATSKFFKRLKNELRIEEDLSMTELNILGHLAFHDVTYPSDLAAMAKVKAQSISQMLNRLDGMKLIEKTPSDTDKRKVAIALSESGRELVIKTRHQRDQWLAGAITKNLTALQKETMKEAITIMETLANTK